MEVESGKVRFFKLRDDKLGSPTRNQAQADIASQFIDLQGRYDSVTSSRIWRWTAWLHGRSKEVSHIAVD